MQRRRHGPSDELASATRPAGICAWLLAIGRVKPPVLLPGPSLLLLLRAPSSRLRRAGARSTAAWACRRCSGGGCRFAWCSRGRALTRAPPTAGCSGSSGGGLGRHGVNCMLLRHAAALARAHRSGRSRGSRRCAGTRRGGGWRGWRRRWWWRGGLGGGGGVGGVVAVYICCGLLLLGGGLRSFMCGRLPRWWRWRES